VSDASEQSNRGESLPHPPLVLIDSSTLRKHLFKGWAVLNCLAAIAREGRATLCVPWIVEREVRSGIGDHINELTGQAQFLASVRQIAPFSSAPEAVSQLCDQFEDLRAKICEEAQQRFAHWLEASQAEKVPLSQTQSERVFDSYFAGLPPFDRPKNREHIPDAYIYHIALMLADAGRMVWFLGADRQLRESLQASGRIRTFAEAYGLFSALGVAEYFKVSQARAALVPELAALNEAGREALQRQLPGHWLRFSGPRTADRRIDAVLSVNMMSCEIEDLRRTLSAKLGGN
jgi:hypothetical protein